MRKYSDEFKVEVVKYYKENGQAKTMSKYQISNTAIHKWERLYDNGGIDGLKRKQTKKYTLQEKLDIIEFYKNNGGTCTESEFNISKSVVSKWERILLEYGESALLNDNRGKGKSDIKKDVNQNEDLLAEVQRLRMENAYLKKLDALVQKREKKQK